MCLHLQAACPNICCNHFSFIFINYETRIFQLVQGSGVLSQSVYLRLQVAYYKYMAMLIILDGSTPSQTGGQMLTYWLQI